MRMRKTILASFFGVAAMSATALLAQPFARTFVSAQTGNDVNTCSPTTPCRTFGKAMTNVNPGGEVIVLDSGGYGPMTIDKSVKITAQGVYAGITATTGDAILINTPSTSDVVILRGLTVNGIGGANGINSASSITLQVYDSFFQGFASNGLAFATGGYFGVHSSTFVGNGTGIFVTGPVGGVKGLIENSDIESSVNFGVYIGDLARVIARNTTASGNVTNYIVKDQLGSYAELTLDRCMALNGATGLAVDGIGSPAGSVILRVSTSTISGNTNGIVAFVNADIRTYSNNILVGNSTNGAFTGTLSPQ